MKLYDMPLFSKSTISVKKGWLFLIRKMGKNIQIYCKMKKRTLPNIVQIKEKYGNLEIYLNDGDAIINSIVKKTQKEAEHICECCGQKEANLKKYDDGIFQTLCDKCFQNKLKR